MAKLKNHVVGCVSADVRELLETGRCTGLKSLKLGRDEAQLRALWEQVGPALTTSWIRAHPGFRPHQWWRFDAPEPQRRRVAGCGETYGECGWSQTDTLVRGVPRYWKWVTEGDLPTYESEAGFLDRLGLLTADERARVPVNSFKAETLAQIFPECREGCRR